MRRSLKNEMVFRNETVFVNEMACGNYAVFEKDVVLEGGGF